MRIVILASKGKLDNAKVVGSMTTEQREMCALTKETQHWYCNGSGKRTNVITEKSRKRKFLTRINTIQW
jgi:hypothetical protein